MRCAILQAINREADTDEAALERSEKHTFDPRHCGAGDCGQRGYDGMRPEDHALDGYGTWAAAAQRPPAAGDGVCLRRAGAGHAVQPVSVFAPH